MFLCLQKDVYRVSDRVMDIFFSSPFPGKVRELENAIERAGIFFQPIAQLITGRLWSAS